MIARASTILISWAAATYGVEGANPHAALGPYTPVSNVIEHSQIVYDIKDIRNAVEETPPDWTTAKSIYTGGRYSCKSTTNVRNLQGFATKDLTGEAFFTSFTAGSGPASPLWSGLGSGRLGQALPFWDTLLLAALDGTGAFAGTTDADIAMRQYAVNKGVLGVLTMYTTHEMESAISKFSAGNTADTQAPHAWDEGWAFLYGGREGQQSAWEFSQKRDSDFTFDSAGVAVAGTASASTLLDNYFREGQAASQASGTGTPTMISSAKNIYRMLALSSIRAALKYSYFAQKGGVLDKADLMEGYAYFLAAAGWVEQASPGTGTAVLALMDYTATPAANLYCSVKNALIPAYAPLGLDCAMVGVYKKFGATETEPTCTGTPACPTGVAALSMGLTSEAALDSTAPAGENVDCETPPPTMAPAAAVNPHAALGPYTPVSNVVEHSQMVYDIKDIVTAAKAEDWTTAKSIYTGGRFSCKTTTNVRTLQGFATKDLTGEAFFTSFTAGTGPASPLWSGLGSGRLGQALPFWDTLLLAALDGTGVFAGTTAAVTGMRQYAVNKGILGVLTMYTTHEMESAISKFNAGSTADTQAPHAWDEGWAFLYGSMADGKNSAWEFSMKRDSDFTFDSAGAAVAGTASGSTLLDNYFRAGQVASRVGGSITDLIAAAKNIYRMLALASIRAAIKYAYMTQKGDYDASAHMEGYTYFLAAAGWVEQASPGTGTAVLALMDYTATPAANLYCSVKNALIPAYLPLGLSCEMVGTYKKFGTSGYVQPTCTGTPACPTGVAALPMGMTSEAKLGTTTPAGENVDCGVAMTTAGDSSPTAPPTTAVPSASAAWRATIGTMSCCVAGALFA